MTRLPRKDERRVDTRWMARGACVGHTALPWTQPLGRVPRMLIDIMADLCDGCPVRDQCAAYAVEAEITVGWWAGRSLNRFTHNHPPTREDLHDDPAQARESDAA